MSLITQFAQYSSEYTYTTGPEADAAGVALGLGVILFILLVVIAAYVFFSLCLMRIFKKAGRQDAWAAWIPVYNNYVYYQVAGRPGWWVFLGFIPFVGGLISIVTNIIASIDMAKSFGKEAGFGILLALVPVIGYPMLAFGNAAYQGPAGPEGGHVDTTAQPPTHPEPPVPPVAPGPPAPPTSTV